MRKKIRLSHNDYFQRQFQKSEFAVSFLRERLPKEIASKMEWDSLRLAPGDFVGKALRHRRSDILYEARMEERDALFYIHLEHQRTPDKKMAFRMLVYTVRIWEQFEARHPQKELPLIYPMVIYQGQKKWSAPLSIHDTLKVPEYMRPFCPEMRYDLMDLSTFDDDDIQGEILQRMVLLVMRNIDAENINESLFNKYLPLFSTLMRKKRGIEYIEDMLYYLSYKSEHMDKEIVIERLGRIPETENLREVIMTLAEKWEQRGIERGIEKGIEKGIERGIDQGKIRLVSKQLTIKFRNDATAWINKLSQLSSDELDLVGERILTAKTPSDVFQGVIK